MPSATASNGGKPPRKPSKPPRSTSTIVNGVIDRNRKPPKRDKSLDGGVSGGGGGNGDSGTGTSTDDDDEDEESEEEENESDAETDDAAPPPGGHPWLSRDASAPQGRDPWDPNQVPYARARERTMELMSHPCMLLSRNCR